MIYLSHLRLNPRSRAVWHDLADCRGLHRTIMRAFPPVPCGVDARAHLGVLYRLDLPRAGGPFLLVQSRAEPDWARLAPGYLIDDGARNKRIEEHYAALHEDVVLAFRLRANPTKRLSPAPDPDGQRMQGKRVELRDETEQLTWLRRKGEQNGFRLLAARVDPAAKVQSRAAGDGGGRPSGVANRLTFGAATFEGELQITDAPRFREGLVQGIGSGKAYGFGLLSVAPPRASHDD